MENSETIKSVSNPVDIEFSPSLLEDGIYKWNKIICFEEKLNYNIDLKKIIQTLKEDIEKDYQEKINKIRDIETRNMRRKYYSYMNNLSTKLNESEEKIVKLQEEKVELNGKIVELKGKIVDLEEEKYELKGTMEELEEEYNEKCNKNKEDEEYFWSQKYNQLIKIRKSLKEHNDILLSEIKQKNNEINLLKEKNEEQLNNELKKENYRLTQENDNLQKYKKYTNNIKMNRLIHQLN
jgi:chromosome segregation ATPase